MFHTSYIAEALLFLKIINWYFFYCKWFEPGHVVFKNVLSLVRASWKRFVLGIRNNISLLKLHRLLRFEYALTFARIFHDIVNDSSFLSVVPTGTCLTQGHCVFFRAWMTFGGCAILFGILWLWDPLTYGDCGLVYHSFLQIFAF